MKLISFVFFLLIGVIVIAQEKDCESFRKGKYFYTPPNGGEVFFRRTKKRQIEKYNDEHQRFIFEIVWTADCEYTLTLIRAKGVDKKIRKEIIGTQLTCIVLDAELGHYEISIVSNNSTSIETFTIYQK